MNLKAEFIKEKGNGLDYIKISSFMWSKITNKLNKEITAIYVHILEREKEREREKANIVRVVNIESDHYTTLAIFW